VKHPILRLDVLAPDGTHATDHVVFCRLQRQSVRVEECCRCVHCDAIQDGAAPTVDCTIPAPAPRSEDPTGELTEVGSLLCRGTVVVADSVPLRKALEVIRHHDRRSVAIVDDEHVMVGLVHDAASMGRLRAIHDSAVSAAMTSAIAVDERTPVRVALKLLAANHLREATVISKHGVPIGVFHDIDGLRWIAAARNDASDPPEG
jgi:CBS domain-containing protein